MKLTSKIASALKRTTAEQNNLFDLTCKSFESIGLSFHPDKPDYLLATHSHQNINFLAIRYGVKKGIKIEIRVDSIPIDTLSVTDNTREFILTLKHYVSGLKPIWAIYTIKNENDIKNLLIIVKRIMNLRPAWGNK